MIKILFVCMGNICRSPAAEGIMRYKLTRKGLVEGDDFIVDSAGTGSTWSGGHPDKRSQAICKEHGVDISELISRQLIPEDGIKYDYIFCMDETNIERAKLIIPSKYHHKIRLINDTGVDDPYRSNEDGFKRMYEEIDEATDVLVNEIVV